MADIVSVGIDIGTSTTQVVFSRLTMENAAGYFAVPRVSIVDKQVIYKGQVHTTPLKSPVLIDGAGVREIVAREYGRAGFRPADVETGAVIITGESARKENAAAVLSELSGFAGDFVVSTAGPDLESIIAGKGSGAWRCSLEEDCVAVNLDIGGGTTNTVAFDCGETVSTGCLDVGGRLIRLGEDLTVQSISPAAAAVAADLELELAAGGRTSLPTLRKITDRMADLLARALGLKPEDELLRHVRTPGSSWFVPPPRVRRVCFSGGVADCIGRQGGEDVPYGDIGVLLGRSIAANPDLAALPRLEAAETIRATVVGAGTYTTTISGSTIDYVAELLPMKNLPVLKLTAGEERRCYEGESSPLAEKIAWFRAQSEAERLVLALEGLADPSYSQLKSAAAAIADAWEASMPPDAPVLVLVERDMAKALGFALRGRTARPVLAVDGIRAGQDDYVDFGRPLMDGMVIPAVVKTLLFG